MTAATITQRLEGGETLLLDGANGTELERRGAPMDHSLWSGMAIDTHPGLIREIHDDYIAAGADLITTNTYCIARHSLRLGEKEQHFQDWNVAACRIAREARDAGARSVALAGSVSTYNSWNILSADELRPSFAEQARLLVEEGVDVIILETLASPEDIVLAAIEETRGLGVPVWFATSCIEERDTGALMLGHEESQEHSEQRGAHAPFDRVIQQADALGVDAILMMHSDLAVTDKAVAEIGRHTKSTVGAYPNAGYWQRPQWTFVDTISPADYAARAMGWQKAGARIIGGCCGLGPEHIAAVRSALDA